MYVNNRTKFSDISEKLLNVEEEFNNDFIGKSLIFKTATGNCYKKAIFYIKALFTTEKSHRNIEKMTDGYSKLDYYKIQHFISESPWSAESAMKDAAKDINKLFAERKKVALIIDESGEEKKGTKSVGVGHQYCGNLGKTCNSQVSVYAALSSDNQVSIIDTRLYLPKSWTDDPARCKSAGIPEINQVFKTKTVLALDIIKSQREAGIRFDWINADGLYGNDLNLLSSLEELNELYVIDIHSVKNIYLEPFELKVKERTSNKGVSPSQLLPNKVRIRANKHIESLEKKDWEKVILREGTKGFLEVETYNKTVYILDNNNECSRKVLVVSRKKNSKNEYEYKYSFSNAQDNAFTSQELAYMQCCRFWIEQSFRDAKQELGMTEYQIRGWLGWHHHVALVMMAMAYSVREKIRRHEDMPLLSISDIRLLIINKFAETSVAKLPIEQQIKNRHFERQKDIDYRYMRNQKK